MNPTACADNSATLGNRRCGFLLALLFVVSCLFATPAMGDKAKIDKAIASYTGTTLPAIAKMKPLIGKSASERAKGFAKLGIGEEHCDAAALDAIYGHQHLAEGAANLCRTLMRWMADDEILTCEGSKYAGVDMAQTRWPRDPIIAKRHKSNGVEKTLFLLSVAAGCTKRDSAYWGVKALEQYDLMSAQIGPAGDLIARTIDDPIPPLEVIEKIHRHCTAARNLAELQNIGVVEGAVSGCYALQNLAQKDYADACEGFNDSLKAISANPDTPPFQQSRATLNAKLVDRLFAPVCATTVARLLKEKAEKDKSADVAAEEARAAAALAQEKARRTTAEVDSVNSDKMDKANSVIGSINWETNYFNGEQKLGANANSREAMQESCQHFQNAISSLRRLAGYFWELANITGDRAYFDSENEARARAISMRDGEFPGRECHEAGYSLQ